MPKIIKNGKEYSGVPIEVVTAWAPTADPVQVKEPLMGNTDISTIGDGTVTGAIDTINTGLSKVHIVDTAVNVTVDDNHRAFITRPTNKHFLIGISSSDAQPKIVAGQNWDGNFIVYCPANAGGYTYTASAFWIVDD